MLSKTGLLIILLVSSLFLVTKNITVWTQKNGAIDSNKPQQTQPLSHVAQFFDKKPQPLSSYESLVSQNLFSQERSEIIPPEKEPVKELPPEPKPEPEPETEAGPEAVPTVEAVKIQGTTIVLHGVLLLDDYKTALITNPLKKEEERDNKWVKVGEKLANLKIDAIEPDRIILRDKNKRFIVLLHDESKPKQAKSGKKSNATMQPTVISTTQADKKARKAKRKASKSSGKNNESEYIIVQTPFGPVKKKK